MKTLRILICLIAVQSLWVRPASAQDGSGTADAALAIQVAMLVILGNNSTTRGSISPSSHYVYPNSNVTPLGSTGAKVGKFGFIFPPGVRAKDLDKLYDRALSKYQNADLILDVKVDTRLRTVMFLFHLMKVTVSGTAAHMEVGKQDIGQENFVEINDNVSSSPIVNVTEPVARDPSKGSVCFWTKDEKLVGKRIIIDHQELTGVPSVAASTPECSASGTLTLDLKPGKYKYTVLVRGIDLTGSIKVIANECVEVELE